jgi:hypothetical protein
MLLGIGSVAHKSFLKSVLRILTIFAPDLDSVPAILCINFRHAVNTCCEREKNVRLWFEITEKIRHQQHCLNFFVLQTRTYIN